MHIGVPKETKNHEYRVGLTPDAVADLTALGCEITIQSSAGARIGFTDDEYRLAGARIGSVEDAFATDMVVKVKEPSLTECARLREGQVLFTYLHLAASLPTTLALMESGVTAIAYETVTAVGGGLPLLAPMSAIAGRMSVQVGAVSLQNPSGGRGKLLAGAPGVAPAKVVVLGGGVVGGNAANMAMGLWADVTVLDNSMPRLAALNSEFRGRAKALMASRQNVALEIAGADLVIGAVLVPGSTTPKLVTRDMLGTMKDGAVLVDVAIDQGGCFESSRPTTHDEPTYIEEGVVHYCVANMPGAVARTATEALNIAVLPYIKALATLGWREAFQQDPGLAEGLNVHAGVVHHPQVADALGLEKPPTMHCHIPHRQSA